MSVDQSTTSMTTTTTVTTSNSTSQLNKTLKIIQNPLVVILGIGNYKKQQRDLSKPVLTDYQRIKWCFNKKRGYTTIYNISTDNKIQIKHNFNENCTIKDDYKLTWTKEEINDFNIQILNHIQKVAASSGPAAGTEPGNSDIHHSKLSETQPKLVSNSKSHPKLKPFEGLIYFISCHGNSGNIIYDSASQEVKIANILNKFSPDICKPLANKPKIFIFDCCRGTTTLQRGKITGDSHPSDPTQFESGISNINNNNNNTEEKKEVSTDATDATDAADATNDDIDDDGACVEEPVVLDEDAKDNNPLKEIERDEYRILSKKFLLIYSNTPGNTSMDVDNKGGYLIRSITGIIGNDDYFNKFKIFDELIMYIKKRMNRTIGDYIDQTVDYNNPFNYNIQLLSKQIDNKKNDNEIKVSNMGISDVHDFTMKRPLIAMIGIGGYSNIDEFKWDSTIYDEEIKKDYKRVHKAMNQKLEYGIVYMRADGQFLHLKKELIKYKEKRGYKTQWTVDDVEEFFQKVWTVLTDEEAKEKGYMYDSLIFIIIGKMTDDSKLYCTDGMYCQLVTLIPNYFGNKECEYLRNKPKIFIIDGAKGEYDINLIKNNNNNNNNGSANNPLTKPIIETTNTFSSILKEIDNKTNDANDKINDDNGNRTKNGNEKGTGVLTNEEKRRLMESYRQENTIRKIFSTCEFYTFLNKNGIQTGNYLISTLMKYFYEKQHIDKKWNEIILDCKVTLNELYNDDDYQDNQVIIDQNTMPYYVKFPNNTNQTN